MTTIDRNGALHDQVGQYAHQTGGAAGYDLGVPASPPPVPHDEAVANDTELARIFGELNRLQSESAHAFDAIHRAADDTFKLTVVRGRSKQGPWQMSNQDAETKARELAASEPPLTDRERHAQEVIEKWGRVPDRDLTGEQRAEVMAAFDNQRDPHSKASRARAAVEKIDALREQRAALVEEAAPYEERYDANPWQRFFLVQASGGHIHKDMNCSTCFPTTQYAWLPTLSGLTEKAAVDQEGAILCSVCFPTAPVEWTIGKAPSDDTCPGSGQQHQWGGPHPRKNPPNGAGSPPGTGPSARCAAPGSR